jgi:hypothetical protein
MAQTTQAQITYAGYGVYNATVDATMLVSNAYSQGQRVFTAGNQWGGDPAPGSRKYLYIVWDLGHGSVSGVVGEGDGNGIILP